MVNLRFSIVAALACALSGCTYFDQYIYNCSGSSIRWLSKSISLGPMSYVGHRPSNPKFSSADWVQYGDGRVEHPVEVRQGQVLASQRAGEWTLPNKVCPQFRSQAVIVDLE